MTEMSSGGAIADRHATHAYLTTLNMVMAIPGESGVRAILIRSELREPLFH